MLALIALLASLTPAPTPQPVTAQARYVAALERMRKTREPKFAVFEASVDVTNGAILARRSEESDKLNFRITSEYQSPTHAGFAVLTYADRSDYAVKIGDGPIAITRLALLNATWRGLDTWMRYGFEGAAPPTPKPVAPSASPSVAVQDPVIAVVTAIGIAYYDVRDGGDGTCPDGGAGHRIELEPRGDPYEHPLRGVTIDDATGLFCSMRFIAPLRYNVFGAPVAAADVEVHLMELDGYFVVSDERVAFDDAAPSGLTVHVVTTIRFDRFAFPDHL